MNHLTSKKIKLRHPGHPEFGCEFTPLEQALINTGYWYYKNNWIGSKAYSWLPRFPKPNGHWDEVPIFGYPTKNFYVRSHGQIYESLGNEEYSPIGAFYREEARQIF